MDRSIYPEGVEVRQTNLAGTESDRIFHILRRHIDTNVLGVVSGFSVSLNTGDNTLIDVAAGTGYSENGEFIELTAALTGISLSDYTTGTVNLVTAIYTETNDDSAAHETNGNSPATTANRSVRIRVFTESEFNLLPQTDTNLSNDDKDRSLILARVTAQGAGVLLTSSNIVNATAFQNAITATNSTGNITGIGIFSIDRTTSAGNGTLSFTFSSSEIRWKPPGETVFGSPTLINTSGLFTVTSAAGKTITILVTAPSLPVSNQTDTIIITNIYDQTVDRFSAEDAQHRSQIGSGTPTATNPHGLTLADLGVSAGDVVTHQDLFHSNGILRTSAPTVLASVVNTTTTPDEVTVTVPILGDSFYLNGIEHSIISNGTVVFSDVGVDQQSLWDIYAVEGANSIATLEKRERIRYDDIAPPPLASVVQLQELANSAPAGAAKIFFNDTDNTLSFFIATDTNFATPATGTGIAVQVPVNGTAQTLNILNEDGTHEIKLFVDDISNWGGIDGSGDITEDLTILSLPTDIELEGRLRISTVMFSGSATGFLGNGFGAGSSPNTLTDQRLFGITGVDDIRDDVTTLISDTVETKSPQEVTVGLGTSNSFGEFNVSDFASAAAAIQAAMDSIANGGGTVHIKSGRYFFDSGADRITFLKQHDGVVLSGTAAAGPATEVGGVTFEFINSTGTFATDAAIDIANNVLRWGIKNIRFDTTDPDLAGGGDTSAFVRISGRRGKISNCAFVMSPQTTSNLYAIQQVTGAVQSDQIIVEDCFFTSNSAGGINYGYIHFEGDSTATVQSNHLQIRDCRFFRGTSSDPLVLVEGIAHFIFKDNNFFLTGSTTATVTALQVSGIGSQAALYSRIIGNEFEGDDMFAGIRLGAFGTTTNYTIIKDNFFIDPNHGVFMSTGTVANSIEADNIFLGIESVPIFYEDTVSGSNNHIAHDNIIVFTSATALAAIGVSSLFDGANVMVHNNIIDMFGDSSPAIIFGNSTGLQHFMASHNIIFNAQPDDGSLAGGTINTVSDTTMISNNIIEAVAGDGDAIQVSDSDNSIVSNNIIRSNAAAYGIVARRTAASQLRRIVIDGNVVQGAETAIQLEDGTGSPGDDFGLIINNNSVSSALATIMIGVDDSVSHSAIAHEQEGIVIAGNAVSRLIGGSGVTDGAIRNRSSFDASAVVSSNFIATTGGGVAGVADWDIVIGNTVYSSRAQTGGIWGIAGDIVVGNQVNDSRVSVSNANSMTGIVAGQVGVGNSVPVLLNSLTLAGGTAIGIAALSGASNTTIVGNRVGTIGSGGLTTTAIGIENTSSTGGTGIARGIIVANSVASVNATGTANAFRINAPALAAADNVYALNVTLGLSETANTADTFPQRGGGPQYTWSAAVGGDIANQTI